MNRFRMQGQGSGEQDSNSLETCVSVFAGYIPEESAKKSILNYNSDPLLHGSLHIGTENYWSYNIDIDGVPYIVGASKINMNLLDRLSSIDEQCNVILGVISPLKDKSASVLASFIEKTGFELRDMKKGSVKYAGFYGFLLGCAFEKIPEIIEQIRSSGEKGIEPPENWRWRGWSLS